MAYYQEYPDFRENVEKIFNQDVRDKKTTGSGIHGRAARLRKHEAVVMPSDRLTGLEKKLIKAPGPLRIYTMEAMKYMDMLERITKGVIPPLAEIEALGFDKAQQCIAELRRLYTNNTLGSAWRMKSTVSQSDLFDKYMVAKTAGGQVIIGQAAIEYRKKHNRKGEKNTRDKHKEIKEAFEKIKDKVEVSEDTVREMVKQEKRNEIKEIFEKAKDEEVKEENVTPDTLDTSSPDRVDTPPVSNTPPISANINPYYNPTWTYTPPIQYNPIQYNPNPVPVVPQPWTEEDRSVVSVHKNFNYTKLTDYLERLKFYLDPDCEFELELKIKEIEKKIEE